MEQNTKERGEVIEILPAGIAVKDIPKGPLFKGDKLKAIRMVLSKGGELPEHTAKGEITVLCVSGRVQFSVEGKPSQLPENHMICLADGTPHAVTALEDSVLLITICG